MTRRRREIMVVRSLTGSDLGLFAAHRTSAKSKQRAININSEVAARVLSPAKYRSKRCLLDCFYTFGDKEIRSQRTLAKSQKNWRLGGKKLEDKEFGVIDTLDFALIRTTESNDGSLPVSVTFIARATRPKMHARIVALVESNLKHSMAVYEETHKGFRMLASLCPLAHPEAAEND